MERTAAAKPQHLASADLRGTIRNGGLNSPSAGVPPALTVCRRHSCPRRAVQLRFIGPWLAVTLTWGPRPEQLVLSPLKDGRARRGKLLIGPDEQSQSDQ